MGSVLILIALAPGIVKKCLEAPQFALITRGLQPLPAWRRAPVTLEPPRWLALVGVGIWLTALLAYMA